MMMVEEETAAAEPTGVAEVAHQVASAPKDWLGAAMTAVAVLEAGS